MNIEGLIFEPYSTKVRASQPSPEDLICMIKYTFESFHTNTLDCQYIRGVLVRAVPFGTEGLKPFGRCHMNKASNVGRTPNL